MIIECLWYFVYSVSWGGGGSASTDFYKKKPQIANTSLEFEHFCSRHLYSLLNLGPYKNALIAAPLTATAAPQ